MFANDTLVLDEFPISPINCVVLNGIGFYMCFLLSGVVLVNALLLLTFLNNKDLRQPINTFIIVITVLNLIGSVFEFPFVIGSTFSCRWIFGHSGCVLSAFLMYFVGCSSVYIMAAISVERFYTIYDPSSMKRITFKKSMLSVQICLLFGVFWPFMPVIGWSHYSLESGLVSCSVTWDEQSVNVMSYNASIFIFVYCIPILVIIITNAKMLSILKSMPSLGNSETDPKIKKKIKMERRVTYVMMVYILLFVMTWTPYALVALTSSFLSPGYIGPMGATFPAVFAKSSMLWSPFFFIFSNKKVKKRLAIGRDTSVAKSCAESSSFVGTMSKMNSTTTAVQKE